MPDGNRLIKIAAECVQGLRESLPEPERSRAIKQFLSEVTIMVKQELRLRLREMHRKIQ